MQCLLLLCIPCPLDVLQAPEDLLLLHPQGVQPHCPLCRVIEAGVAHVLVARQLCLMQARAQC